MEKIDDPLEVVRLLKSGFSLTKYPPYLYQKSTEVHMHRYRGGKSKAEHHRVKNETLEKLIRAGVVMKWVGKGAPNNGIGYKLVNR